jgi:hypothetical protein
MEKLPWVLLLAKYSTIRVIKSRRDVHGMWQVCGKRNGPPWIMWAKLGTRPFGRSRCICEHNIKMDLERWEGVGWINLSQYQDRWRTVLKTVLNLKLENLTSWVTSRFSRMTLLPGLSDLDGWSVSGNQYRPLIDQRSTHSLTMVLQTVLNTYPS